MTTPHAILAAKTAHFTPRQVRDRDWLLEEATAMLGLWPHASPEAIMAKLLCLHDAPRWVRVLIARAAISTVRLAA